jgi:hypothetical protein
MATGNHNLDPQMQLTFFDEATAQVQLTSASTEPSAAPVTVETEVSLDQGQPSDARDEEMSPEQEADFDRNMELSGFTRATALGRVGVKRNVTETPVRTTGRSKTGPKHRPYVRRSDPDYKGVPWNLQ